jgi:hypothetical protein
MVYGMAMGLLIGAWFAQELQAALVALLAGGVATAVIGTAFHHLTVEDVGEALTVRFGPLPMFRMEISYADIESVAVGRTLFVDGWGIHYSVRGGQVWNLWGRDCVVVHRRNSVLRIGTDDAANLARFLDGKLAGRQHRATDCSATSPPRSA